MPEVSRTARQLLAAFRRGNPGELEAELDRAARACRLIGQYPAGEEERRELLEGIIDELRKTPPPERREDVFERLLAHLSRPAGDGCPLPHGYLC